MKNTENIKTRNLDEFEKDVNLYRLVSGGQNNALELLRKIVDKIHLDNSANPSKKLPSILIHGKEGTRLHALALLNSLCIVDIRECKGIFLDNGLNSRENFEDSYFDTAHLITSAEEL